ncbi:MAG: hypothetical protein R2838_23855 [Caldilineaceae bacterium]
MLTEINNEAIALAGGEPITIVANYFFSVGAPLAMAIVATVVTERAGRAACWAHTVQTMPRSLSLDAIEDDDDGLSDAERRGLRPRRTRPSCSWSSSAC